VTITPDAVHARLGIARLRYGVPALDCCDLVRRGADRVRVAELMAEYRRLDPEDQQEVSRVAFVARRLQEDAEAAASASVLTGRPKAFPHSRAEVVALTLPLDMPS
jgi:hypothetical protein